MGHFSDLAIQEAESGINAATIEGRRVCRECFADEHIRNEVSRAAEAQECDYCGAKGDAVEAAPLAGVVQFILNQIDHEYASADQSLPVDPDTKERMFPEDEFDTRTMLELHVDLQLPRDDDGSLMEDIARALPEQDWCLRDPLSVRDDEAIASSWEAFKRIVMHERRFFFLGHRDEALEYDLRWGEARYDPSELLEAIGRFARNHGLLARMDRGTPWYRIQRMEPGEADFDARRMGPPPLEHAMLPNRMSPVGIPMFYGAAEKETALVEVAEEDDRYACARFEILDDLMVLDVRQPPEVPSLFDPEHARDRAIAMFMRSFVEDFASPIDRERRAHLDYLPTQVVTEYVRTMVTAEEDEPISGVLYRSSRDGGDAVVLFATTEAVAIEGDDTSGWLAMNGYEEIDHTIGGAEGAPDRDPAPPDTMAAS